jgi:hypothetical protein
VQGSYGPHGTGCLVVTTGGGSAFALGGRAILESLLPSCTANPIALVVVRAALAHAAAVGDGSIGFVLMFSAALKKVTSASEGMDGHQQRVFITRLASCLRGLATNELHQLAAGVQGRWAIDFERLVVWKEGSGRDVATASECSREASCRDTETADDEEDLELAEELARALVSTALAGRCCTSENSETLEDLLIDVSPSSFPFSLFVLGLVIDASPLSSPPLLLLLLSRSLSVSLAPPVCTGRSTGPFFGCRFGGRRSSSDCCADGGGCDAYCGGGFCACWGGRLPRASGAGTSFSLIPSII